MSEEENSPSRAVSRSNRDVSFYRQREAKLLAQLESEIKLSNARPAEHAGQSGQLIRSITDELLQHPLCRHLAKPPKLCVHISLEARMGTFADVIIVPGVEIGLAADDPKSMEILRAEIAHELGHLIAQDAVPERQVSQENNDLNAEIERRADLIAAHLCGDGGAALASWAKRQKQESESMASIFGQSWCERVANQAATMITRYPNWQERVNYLQLWAQDFQRGKPLPEPDLTPFVNSKRPRTNDRTI
jgi:hypothetical protein